MGLTKTERVIELFAWRGLDVLTDIIPEDARRECAYALGLTTVEVDGIINELRAEALQQNTAVAPQDDREMASGGEGVSEQAPAQNQGVEANETPLSGQLAEDERITAVAVLHCDALAGVPVQRWAQILRLAAKLAEVAAA